MESYINLLSSNSKLISGKPIYPQNTEVVTKGSDTYVPGLKDAFMLAYNYPSPISKRMVEYSIQEEYKVPPAPIGWYMSEKFDGQRSLWDGSKFVTRGSASSLPRVYPYVPEWFVALMPPGIALDGEFFIARNSFQDLGFLKSKLKPESERKKSDNTQIELDNKWINIKYQVFDLINNDPFEKRFSDLKKIISERQAIWSSISLPPYLKKGECPLRLTNQIKVKSEADLNKYYSELTSEEAEGVMLRAPNVKYIQGRTRFLLKLKPEEDAECTITGYKPGEGKYQGLLGAFECNFKGHTFYVGGMNDSIRSSYRTTHPIGTVITFKYTSLTDGGIPRHPRYFRLFN